jgi:hypothetical protein
VHRGTATEIAALDESRSGGIAVSSLNDAPEPGTRDHMQQQTIEVALTRPHEPWKLAPHLRAQKLNEVRFRRLADA